MKKFLIILEIMECVYIILNVLRKMKKLVATFFK